MSQMVDSGKDSERLLKKVMKRELNRIEKKKTRGVISDFNETSET